MSRQKTRQVGTAGLVTRYSSGIVMRTCRRCHQADTPPSWRAALREARAHATRHDSTDARDVDTPWGIPAQELPPARRTGALRRLAIAVLVVVLTALLLPALLGPLTSHAAPAPVAPPTSVGSTTTPGPHHASARASSDAGGGR